MIKVRWELLVEEAAAASLMEILPRGESGWLKRPCTVTVDHGSDWSKPHGEGGNLLWLLKHDLGLCER